MVKHMGVSELWRIVAIALITTDLTGLTGWLLFGMDSVKHSEIDQIMATRAPYMHDKQRIDERFKELERRIDNVEKK